MSEDPLANTKGVVNVSSRREWDKEAYRKKAIERQERQAYKGVARRVVPGEDGKTKRPLLDGRDKKFVDETLDKRQIGKTKKVNPEGEGGEQGGFYCELCDKTYKDDMAFLEHVNSRMHQAKLGLSMHVKKSSAEEVKSRLKMHVARRVEETTKGKAEEEKYDFFERIRQLDEEQEAKKKRAKEAKKRKKEKKKQLRDQLQDEEIAQMMGFGSFGSSKS